MATLMSKSSLYSFRTSMNQSTANSSEPLSTSSIVTGTLGAICSLIVLTLLILVVCVYKAYRTTFQRLILYHIIFSLLCELSVLLVIPYFEEKICAVVIYLSLFFINSWSVYTTVVTNCLLIFTIRLLRNSPRIWRHGKVAECICICSAIIVPLMYVWIPLTEGSGGVTMCSEYETRFPKDYKIATVFHTIYLIMTIEVVFVSVVMCCLFCFLRLRYQSRALSGIFKHLLCYALTNTAYIVFIILFAVVTYFFYHRPGKSLTFVVNVMSGTGLSFLVLVSTLMLSLLAIRPNCKCLCCSKADCGGQQVDENVNETQGATNPTSHPMNQPSHTYFSIPYTGAFTQVTVSDHNEEKGERTPLI